MVRPVRRRLTLCVWAVQNFRALMCQHHQRVESRTRQGRSVCHPTDPLSPWQGAKLTIADSLWVCLATQAMPVTNRRAVWHRGQTVNASSHSRRSHTPSHKHTLISPHSVVVATWFWESNFYHIFTLVCVWTRSPRHGSRNLLSYHSVSVSISLVFICSNSRPALTTTRYREVSIFR